MSTPEGFGIGSKIWTHGVSKPRTVVAETKLSWVLDKHSAWAKDEKVSKKNPNSKHYEAYYFFTQAEMEEQVWARQHVCRISHCVQFIRDPVVLRKIAHLIDYDEQAQRIRQKEQ